MYLNLQMLNMIKMLVTFIHILIMMLQLAMANTYMEQVLLLKPMQEQDMTLDGMIIAQAMKRHLH